jgi:hypothetical protein
LGFGAWFPFQMRVELRSFRFSRIAVTTPTVFVPFETKPKLLQKTTNFYHNLGYWLLFYIVLVFAGFYTTYFSIILKPQPSIIHIHFALMAMWIIMLITQPFLIKYKKVYWHRAIGKISYVLVPLLLASCFLMLRYSYYRELAGIRQRVEQGSLTLTNTEILGEAASLQTIVFYYMLTFMTFYLLAIINRKKSFKHSRYMLATSLALLGPTVDRILFIPFGLQTLPFGITVMAGAFIIADLILALLLLKDYRERKPTSTLLTCLLITLIFQLLYFTVPYTAGWGPFVSFLMQPAP